MEGLVQVKLRETGTLVYYLVRDISPKNGDCVIVEAERGLDYGEALSEPVTEVKGRIPHPLRKIIRVANENDLKQIELTAKSAAASSIFQI